LRRDSASGYKTRGEVKRGKVEWRVFDGGGEKYDVCDKSACKKHKSSIDDGVGRTMVVRRGI